MLQLFLLCYVTTRGVFLVALPLSIYVASFYAHLTLLHRAGPNDDVMTSAFQASLEVRMRQVSRVTACVQRNESISDATCACADAIETLFSCPYLCFLITTIENFSVVVVVVSWLDLHPGTFLPSVSGGVVTQLGHWAVERDP